MGKRITLLVLLTCLVHQSRSLHAQEASGASLTVTPSVGRGPLGQRWLRFWGHVHAPRGRRESRPLAMERFRCSTWYRRRLLRWLRPGWPERRSGNLLSSRWSGGGRRSRWTAPVRGVAPSTPRPTLLRARRLPSAGPGPGSRRRRRCTHSASLWAPNPYRMKPTGITVSSARVRVISALRPGSQRLTLRGDTRACRLAVQQSRKTSGCLQTEG